LTPELATVQNASAVPENRETLAAIALGGNWPSQFGTPDQTIGSALGDIARVVGAIVAVSRFFRTPAFPIGSGPDFVNAAVLVRTVRSAKSIVGELHAIEARYGRERTTRWGGRTLDLDLLFLGESVLPDPAMQRRWAELPPDLQRVETPVDLILPHPRLQDRGFVLIPLVEIAPLWRHPLTGRSVAEMAAALPAADREGICPV